MITTGGHPWIDEVPLDECLSLQKASASSLNMKVGDIVTVKGETKGRHYEIVEIDNDGGCIQDGPFSPRFQRVRIQCRARAIWYVDSSLELAHPAVQFAFTKHKGQIYRSYENEKDSYFHRHLVSVASRFPVGSVEWQLGFLHDYLEDCEGALCKHMIDFGIAPYVVTLCSILNKNLYDSYEDYIDAVLSYPETKAVKISDIQTNISHSPSKTAMHKYAKALLILTA